MSSPARGGAGCVPVLNIDGRVNTTCAIAAGIQGAETIKIILGLNSELDGGILCFNSLGPVFRVFRLK